MADQTSHDAEARWTVIDQGTRTEGWSGFVLEFHRRATMADMEDAVNTELQARGVGGRDVVTITPILSLSRREVWYYKGASGQ